MIGSMGWCSDWLVLAEANICRTHIIDFMRLKTT
jgi:hypothetical protein